MLVDVKIHGNAATILMDRSDVRNALNLQMIEDLQTAFSDVHQEKRAKSVVLAGTGDHFCAGIDLRMLLEISNLPTDQSLANWYQTWRGLTELYETMLRFPKPIVAAVDGGAIGSGLGIALAADIIVASDRANFVANAVHRGIVGGGTAALLAFRLGGSTAARMLLTGQPVDAEEAYRIGICGLPVPVDQVWVAASEIANQCGQGPVQAVQATKRLLNERIGETLLSQLASGAADSATACTHPSAIEGVEAFLQRREPDWP